MSESGTRIFTTDRYHIYEKFDDGVPQVWLARDYDDWVRTHQMIKMLQKRTNAKMVPGNCAKTLSSYETALHAYQ